MKIPFTEPTVRDRQGASTESAACDHPGSHHEPAVCDHPGFTPLARATIPSEAVRKAAGGLQRFRPGGQTSSGLLVVLAFRRLTPVPPERSRRNARTTSTRSPVCPPGRNRWRTPAAFRPGITILPKTPYILLIRSIASTVFSYVPKAVSRKYPSPLGPKPEPGVPTTFAVSSR